MRLALGYVPLVDAAALIAAVELGFVADEGLSVDLVREPSWATLRDKLALGHLDGAHMLGALAIASALGLSGPQTRLVAPLALNLNGNAITLSLPLWRAMEAEGEDVATVARAFARAAERRTAQGRALALGTVHPFSSHTYQLRLFAELGGLDIDRSARIVVIPPPLIAQALRGGVIDGFCAGSPWNSVAVEEGYGRIAAFGSEIAPECPEKVLALPEADAGASLPLTRALRRAGRWCGEACNIPELAAILARGAHLGVAPALIERALRGDVVVAYDGARRRDPRFIALDEAAQRPSTGQVDWLLGRMAAAGQIAVNPEIARRARAIYRPDLFDAAAAG